MTIRSCLLVSTLAVGVGSCGGGDATTKTVVQTVSQTPAATPPATATASTPSEPATAAPSAAAAAVANLPDGAVALQGSFRMKVVRVANNNFLIPGQQNDEKGAARLWVAETQCAAGACRVRLRRELPSGGFERSTLKQGADARSFGETAKIQKKYCGNPDTSSGPAIKRTSVHISAVEDRAGQPTAIRIGGFVTLSQTCATGGARLAGHSTLAFRGTLEG